MLILNAGLETIEFGHNQNSRDKKLGGYYKVEAGEQVHIPDTARDQIHNPHSGEGLKGMVILDHGCDDLERKTTGLQQYIKGLNVALGREQQRTIELKQVGITSEEDRPEIEAIKKRIKKAEEALKKLETVERVEDVNIPSDANKGKKQFGRSVNSKPKSV